MCEDLDTQAENYMRSVMNNNGDVFTRSDLYEYIIDAYKQGYRDANDLTCLDNKCNHRKPPIPYEIMSEETAKELEDILAKTREESVKYAAVQKDLQEIIRQVNAQQLPKDLPNLISKEDFRNRLNHKDE